MGYDLYPISALSPITGKVTSGMRANCEIEIFLNVPLTLQSGIKLFRSTNNVVLSPGNASGTIPVSLFKCVRSRLDGK